jgi:hypothetical protein
VLSAWPVDGDGLQQPADLVVGILDEGGEDLGLTGEQPFLIRAQAVPVLDRLGLGCKHRVLGHDAALDLTRQNLLAQAVPALVEFPLPARDPILRHMVRGVGGAGREIDEEGFIGRQRLLILHPGYGLVGHVGHEVIVGILRQLDHMGAVVDEGRPLVGLAAEEAIELVEALVGRPAVEGTRDARLPGRQLMPFTEGTGAVAVEAQHLGQRRDLIRDLAGVAGKGGAGLDDRAHVVDMVIAPALERGAGRRADRGGVEVVVVQPFVGDLLEGRGVDRSAEGAGAGEAEIVDQDQQDVRRALRGLDIHK